MKSKTAGDGQIDLHILHKLPTPYNDMFFRALHADENINLQVYHLWRGSWRRPWKTELATGYPNIYMQLKMGVDWNLLKRAWTDVDGFFLIADWGHFASLAVILTRYLRRAPVAIWADTPQEDIYRPALKKWLRRKFLRSVLRRTDIVFGTGAVGLRVLAAMGAKPERLVNLPCFVDLERPVEARADREVCERAARLREQVGCGKEGVVFSMVGTLVEKKGNDIGLEAFARCRRESRNPVGMLIVGEGPDRPMLEKMVADLGLSGSVAFLGWQEPREMESVYLASNAVVHPARYDPFPLVVLETMSWSKAIIGSDACGSIEDRVRHKINGMSFRSEDVDDLAKILLEVSDAPEKLEEMGRRARETAETWHVTKGVEIIRGRASEVFASNA